MENVLRKTTEIAKLICDQYIDEDSIVVDATCGNGNDTLYYAKKCRFVYGFDIQTVAIENTEKLLKENSLDNYCLIQDTHSNLKQYVKENPDLVIFNLGYLPSGDKEITTMTTSTIQAIISALDLIKINGLICIVLYYGHKQGKEERVEVIKTVSELDSKLFHVGYFTSPNQQNCPPEIVFITKKK